MTAAAAAGAPPAPLNRTMIVASVMLATILTALDATIANVALPHMAGSVSASQDQIAWVLTSYIVASAICTPMTGWLSNRFGRKRLLVIAVTGFIAASALCGAAQNLAQIVLFRVAQGAFAAPLIPMSQALILDIFTLSERGPAMSIWGVGVMVAPIVGPVLGGWLTDSLSWRWVFYINLPVGALCLLGIMTFIPDTPPDRSRRFDIVGFSLLAIAIAAVQLAFDRGQSQGWFDSAEIIAEASVAFAALWFSFVHSFTSEKPFLPLGVFKDRNFSAASLLGVMVGVVIFSVAALLPTMLQSEYGYSVLQAGMLTAPRGFGSIVSMLVVGRLIGRVDTRILLIVGQAIFAGSFYHMSLFTLDTPSIEVISNGVFQGLGTGLVFLPLTTMAFATLAPDTRGDATSFYTLMRNLGGSAGISIMLALLVNFSAGARGQLVEPYSPENPMMQPSVLPQSMSITDATGVVVLSSQIDRQAAMLGYTQVFHFMFIVTLAMMPVVLLMRSPTQAPSRSAATAPVEH
ncbi:MAG: DHA2 family efflux MFS transporter permease subunit [Proteobacteria bacterium]|nr:DHA2 family efflux MFS transporter permease subunit [Pseudomonadota bacterium]